METAPLSAPTSDASPEAERDDRNTVLVTGATSGIGRALAKQFAKAGWRILLHGRDPVRLASAQESVGRHGLVTPLRADLADLDAVRQLAADVRAQTGRLDVLVNNAGRLTPTCRLTPQHIETTMAVNAVAPFVLYRELRPLLEATAREHGGARLVNVTSEAHRGGHFDEMDPEIVAMQLKEPPRGYHAFKAYCQSKLALTAWTMEAARDFDRTGVAAHACHPGLVRARIFPGLGGAKGFFASVFRFLYLPPALGARVPFTLATAPEYGRKSGVYLKRSHFRGPHEALPPKQGLDPDWTSAAWDAMRILAGMS